MCGNPTLFVKSCQTVENSPCGVLNCLKFRIAAQFQLIVGIPSLKDTSLVKETRDRQQSIIYEVADSYIISPLDIFESRSLRNIAIDIAHGTVVENSF